MLTLLAILVAACVFVSLNGAGDDINSLPVFPKAKWTVAVYMNGDNNLEASITGGLTSVDSLLNNPSRTAGYEAPGDFHSELAALGSTSNVHVVALVDRTPGYTSNMDDWTNTRLYYIRKDDFPDNDSSTFWSNSSGNDEMNMADPASLVWFIKTAQKHFPSDHLLLSIWDHNWGWHDGYFEKDETSGSATISYSKLTHALRSVPENSIDIVSYDACVAAQAEVVHTWRPYVRFFVGSQDYVGWGGIDYSVVIDSIDSSAGAIAPANLSTIIAQSMLTDEDDHCATALEMSSTFDLLVAQVDVLAQLFITHFSSIENTLQLIREQSAQTPATPSDNMHRDLKSIASGVIIQLEPAYPEFGDVGRQIQSLVDQIVLFNKVTGKSCDGGNGLTIYWPKNKRAFKVEPSYLLLSFSAATKWDEFLSLYCT